MTVRELVERLQAAPPEAEVFVDRGGAYNDCRSVQIYNAVGETLVYRRPANHVDSPMMGAMVFISDEKES